MKEIYEAKANINLPSLGSTIPAGSRLEVEDGRLLAQGQSAPVGPDFQILLRHSLIVPLTAKQAAAPENVAEPKTRPRYERKKLPVTTADDTIVKDVVVRGRQTQDQHIVDYENGADRSKENERRIRGMLVDETISRDIPPRGGAPKAAAPEAPKAGEPATRLAPKHPVDEATRNARIQALEKAAEPPKEAKPAKTAAPKESKPAKAAPKANKAAKAKKEGK